MLWAQSTSAQTIPKPSIPEFTIETTSFPYDVPPTTTTKIDPYTGKETVTTQPGYHVENTTTQIKIRNQPFTPFQIQEDNRDWTLNLFYNIRYKGHFAQGWSYYRLHNGSSDGNLRQASSVGYTVVPIDDYLPAEGSMDFQIEALIGYEQGIVSVPGAPGTSRVITGETSGWSSIQTITIGENTTTAPTVSPSQSMLTETVLPSENPSTTPIKPDTQTGILFDWQTVAIVVLVVVVGVLAVGVVLLWRRKPAG